MALLAVVALALSGLDLNGLGLGGVILYSIGLGGLVLGFGGRDLGLWPCFASVLFALDLVASMGLTLLALAIVALAIVALAMVVLVCPRGPWP